MEYSTLMLKADELIRYLPDPGMSYNATFTVELKPKQNRAQIFDGQAVFLPENFERKKYTAVQFSNEMEANNFMNQNMTTPHKFRGFLHFQKRTGESYVLGEWVGLTVEEWISESSELWESDNNGGRRATQVLKRAGYAISKLMFNFHDKNTYMNVDLDDIYINPVTSVITLLRVSPTQQQNLRTGIWRDLQLLVQFVKLCNQHVSGQLSQCVAVDYEMFNTLCAWVPHSVPQIKEQSYIICHASIFWWRPYERFNFASSFWLLDKMDNQFHKHVTFADAPTRMRNWIPKAIRDAVFGQEFDPTTYNQSRIMEFHRYAFNHFGSMDKLVTLEDIDERLLNLFPDAYPKAYLELFTKYFDVHPNLVEVLRFGQWPLRYDDN